MTDVNDVLYNMQSLKQFQWNINQIQNMKNGISLNGGNIITAKLKNPLKF